jgi:hypothetical protein
MDRGIFFAGLVLMTSGSCKPPPAVEPADSGYLLPGPQAAAAFGVPAGVRIQEIHRRVPRQVTDAAARLAQERHKRSACNRFFQSGDVYIVVLAAFCGRDYGKETDSRLLIGVRSSGSLIAEISWMTKVGEAELHPYMRFQ